MNLATSRSLHPHMRDEEALVVENAIRLAVDSIVNVLYGVNSARSREYQRMVADRDKEIQRLECRLTEIEDELQALRPHGCTCRLGPGTGTGTSRSSGDHRLTGGEQGGFEPGGTDNELMASGQQECEMSISLGLFARPASHLSSQSHESALPSSPSRMGLDQTSSTSRSSEASCVTEAARNMPTSPSGLVVKEEPCDVDLIKWEMSEERAAEHQDSGSSPRQDRDGASGKKTLVNREGNRLMENPQIDPLRFIMVDEHLR
ncbi:uncharacterized protein LOC125015893 [Mugil cephalus]|uniref:uncharacterized protein LOC125015893 n=1 Tax=Mugil cephalus TaxID=48193 RepID=UPI001FB61B2F|nr:uncharacterized protein LOC125015893 [Mugil cephalus]